MSHGPIPTVANQLFEAGFKPHVQRLPGSGRRPFPELKNPGVQWSIKAFVDKAHETSRLLLEGERVLEAGHVFSCSIKKLGKDCYTFFGFILQTSALTSDLHELETTLNGKMM
ncbi:hypothetical protein HPB47_020469 [Ixodes persulcatus]|uniref:Uncharacterized protein n=1 Tax=Ixodes persulcatus TaxID=34615 RepID=A0AC60QFF7_IXOPE|nr:hypothetical protein HPB47_020469 [Ixodes persulcatus]